MNTDKDGGHSPPRLRCTIALIHNHMSGVRSNVPVVDPALFCRIHDAKYYRRRQRSHTRSGSLSEAMATPYEQTAYD